MMVAAYIKEDTDIKEEESDYDEYEYDCAMTRMSASQLEDYSVISKSLSKISIQTYEPSVAVCPVHVIHLKKQWVH